MPVVEDMIKNSCSHVFCRIVFLKYFAKIRYVLPRQKSIAIETFIKNLPALGIQNSHPLKRKFSIFISTSSPGWLPMSSKFLTLLLMVRLTYTTNTCSKLINMTFMVLEHLWMMFRCFYCPLDTGSTQNVHKKFRKNVPNIFWAS